MKKLYLIVAMVLLLNYTQAQSFTVPNAKDTITSSIAISSEGYQDKIIVENNSNVAKDVKIDRISQTLASGHENYYCWNQCFPPSVSQSGALPIPANGNINNLFSVHTAHNGSPGISTATYRIYDAADSTDYVDVSFVFEVLTVSAIDEFEGEASLDVFPNPASQQLNISLELSSQKGINTASLIDQTGRVVRTTELDNMTQMDVSNLSPGLYQLRVFNTPLGLIETKKVLINLN